jgi:hypothetical protein
MCKILTGLINKRISEITENIFGEYHCGFWPNRSTAELLFIMRQIIEKHYEHGINLYFFFIDYQKAFDSINRNALIQIMEQLDILKKLINLTKITLNQTRIKVKIGNRMGEAFQ